MLQRVPQTIDVRPRPPPASTDTPSVLSDPDVMMIDWGCTPGGSGTLTAGRDTEAVHDRRVRVQTGCDQGRIRRTAACARARIKGRDSTGH